jgi:hypothetical protein
MRFFSVCSRFSSSQHFLRIPTCSADPQLFCGSPRVLRIPVCSAVPHVVYGSPRGFILIHGLSTALVTGSLAGVLPTSFRPFVR